MVVKKSVDDNVGPMRRTTLNLGKAFSSFSSSKRAFLEAPVELGARAGRGRFSPVDALDEDDEEDDEEVAELVASSSSSVSSSSSSWSPCCSLRSQITFAMHNDLPIPGAPQIYRFFRSSAAWLIDPEADEEEDDEELWSGWPALRIRRDAQIVSFISLDFSSRPTAVGSW